MILHARHTKQQKIKGQHIYTDDPLPGNDKLGHRQQGNIISLKNERGYTDGQTQADTQADKGDLICLLLLIFVVIKY
jgi:hypothetical protein